MGANDSFVVVALPNTAVKFRPSPVANTLGVCSCRQRFESLNDAAEPWFFHERLFLIM